MALQITKTIGGIEISTYAVITKFWHSKFELVQIPTGEMIKKTLSTGGVIDQPAYEQKSTVYVQIEHFKDRDTAYELKSSDIKETIMLTDFDPNDISQSTLAQLYKLLKAQKPEYQNSVDVLE
jgi:hypothetical protein